MSSPNADRANRPAPLGITDVVLRDAHQSLLATRLRLEDMLPVAAKLDRVGYWSVESWGGATFDACIRFLGEDPWERIRALKSAMPRTPQQMLLRGQNLLGYRNYADDVVARFVERAAENGVDVFRVFDALNDVRNLRTAIRAVVDAGRHAQGTIAYTTSPVHTLDGWVDTARRIEDLGAHSLCIKDMAGLLRPYEAHALVSRLKASLAIPVHLHCHATTGLSTATILKAVEAGIDNVDTSISAMSMTYGHSATEAVVAIFEGTGRDTGLDLALLQEIADDLRAVRSKYVKHEGSLRGIDARILVAQVPGGMLTNLESQLREQGALGRYDEVLAEIPRVRADLGHLPLVTPTSQIVGTQAVLNVLAGERYRSVARETAALLRGEYGATPAPCDPALQARVLGGDAPVSCRPADLLKPELDTITAELRRLAHERKFRLAADEVDDVLTYAMFPQVGLKFLQERGNPGVFEESADGAPRGSRAATGDEVFTVGVNGCAYTVHVAGPVRPAASVPVPASTSTVSTVPSAPPAGEPVRSPLAGNVVRVLACAGQAVQAGDVVLILEAMKMETEVRAARAGTVTRVGVREGDTVAVGTALLALA